MGEMPDIFGAERGCPELVKAKSMRLQLMWQWLSKSSMWVPVEKSSVGGNGGSGYVYRRPEPVEPVARQRFISLALAKLIP